MFVWMVLLFLFTHHLDHLSSFPGALYQLRLPRLEDFVSRTFGDDETGAGSVTKGMCFAFSLSS
jgi:hypothetical protein